MAISINAVKPFGCAFTSCLWRRYHPAGTSITSRTITLFSSRAATVLVTDRSKGRTVLPSGRVSTIFPSYSPSGAMLNPSHDAPSDRWREEKQCQPPPSAEERTITGR